MAIVRSLGLGRDPQTTPGPSRKIGVRAVLATALTEGQDLEAVGALRGW